MDALLATTAAITLAHLTPHRRRATPRDSIGATPRLGIGRWARAASIGRQAPSVEASRRMVGTTLLKTGKVTWEITVKTLPRIPRKLKKSLA